MREIETLRLALRECEFHQSLYSKTEKTLEVYRKLMVWRCPQSLIHCNQERITSWCVYITIIYIDCFEAVARGLEDVSNNRLKCAVVPA